MNWWTFAAWVVGWVLLFLLLPPRYDPAILLKELLERQAISFKLGLWLGVAIVGPLILMLMRHP